MPSSSPMPSVRPPSRPDRLPLRARLALVTVGVVAVGLAVSTGDGALAGPERLDGGSVQEARAASTVGLFPGGMPKAKIRSHHGSRREVGMRFSPKVAGSAVGVRVLKMAGAKSATPRTGSLWSSRGTLLASASFTRTKGTGWVQVRFSQPVALKPGKTYVVSAYAASGRFAVTRRGLADTRSTDQLTAQAGKNGVYRSKRGTGFPNHASPSKDNYWVDVRFAPGRDGTTTTPTATPTPNGVCMGAANTPGGPDPWGGCWPGPHNTGYPHGLPGDTRAPVTLTPYTGPTTIRSCGVVIDSKQVNSTLVIEAGNGTTSPSTPCVTIRNSLVKGVIFAEKTSYGPTVVEDTEIAPTDLPFWENLGRSNFYATRVNSHGGQAVIKCELNCVAKDSWVHGMELGGAYHYNAFGGNGTSNFTINHNYGSCGDWETVSSPEDDAGCSAVIGFYGDYDPIQNISITYNFLASTFSGTGQSINRQAGYCLNPGYYPGKPYPDTANLTVTDNVFARGSTNKCGVFGPSNSLHGRGQPNGSVWARNRYADGAAISLPTE
ncbi:DUF4082 domain-containing protein [Nocardioides oleivorans]|uniref:DUF4082 domain-containing protein n=1 Tax=Nocardioides oleivorans TaxID=273676 RepID=A0A4Q2S3I1_9ACTN|nr:DUF4082 domain-containing protein [Nocardioides oleivorans]RYB94909.1 DUF4082 domain-containing protein [Nocardioides oleivorans]